MHVKITRWAGKIALIWALLPATFIGLLYWSHIRFNHAGLIQTPDFDRLALIVGLSIIGAAVPVLVCVWMSGWKKLPRALLCAGIFLYTLILFQFCQALIFSIGFSGDAHMRKTMLSGMTYYMDEEWRPFNDDASPGRGLRLYESAGLMTMKEVAASKIFLDKETPAMPEVIELDGVGGSFIYNLPSHQLQRK